MTLAARRRVDVALAVTLGVALPVSLAFSRELFLTFAGGVAALVVLYLLVRPELAAWAYRWSRPRAHRIGAAALAAVALLGAMYVIGELRLHPSVDAQGESALWAEANITLGRVVAADLRWQAASLDRQDEAVAELQRATRTFAEAVNALERVRPPEARAEVHAAVTAVYRELAEVVAKLPDALARSDTDAAAAIWRRAGTLNQEAGTLILLTSPDKAGR